MKDLILRMPEGQEITQLVMTGNADEYISPLMQRVVVLFMLHRDDDLLVDGEHILDIVASSTAAGVSAMLGSFLPVARRLKVLMNSDGECVDNIEFAVDITGTAFKLIINVTPIQETTESVVIYSNG